MPLRHDNPVTPLGDDRRRRLVAIRAARLVAEIIALMVILQLYKLVRRTFVQRGEEVAFANADQIMRWETRLGIDIELGFQRAVIEHEWLIRLLNRDYAYFMWTFYVCAGIAFLLARRAYPRLRGLFIASSLIALPWYALYPLAPPRFLTDRGFIDTLAVYGPNYFSNTGLVKANQFAAMPSMHIGWTIVAALMLAAALPRWRLGPILGTLHVGLMCVVVVATGNHFVLDIVGGAAVVAAALFAVRLMSSRVRRKRAVLDEQNVSKRHQPIDMRSSA